MTAGGFVKLFPADWQQRLLKAAEWFGQLHGDRWHPLAAHYREAVAVEGAVACEPLDWCPLDGVFREAV